MISSRAGGWALGILLCVPTAWAQDPKVRALDGPPGAGPFRSFGGVGEFFQVDNVRPGASVAIRLKSARAELLQPETIRLFRLAPGTRAWRLVPESTYDPRTRNISGRLPGSGVYTAAGASRFEEVFDGQQLFCRSGGTKLVPPVCTRILCPAPFAMAGDPRADIPVLISQAELGAAMGSICDECLRGPSTPVDFVDCQLPAIVNPVPGLKPVYPIWPKAFDASDGCRAGNHFVGTVEYNFENEFDLTPSGSTTPAYPAVDVRAVVRYPAASSGSGKPVAGAARYPLVLFLHGNHATCPCSCSHACAPASRVPNHLGYNYLLDVLATWGFIAVSIDGFDVTCAGSATMSDYEARGRLVLRHLQKWKDWDAAGTDPWGGLFKTRVDMSRIGLSGHSRGGEGVAAAEFINRAENLGYQIQAVNAIAPTDQDPYVRYVPRVPYFLLLGASDGDVWNLQGLRTYDRTSLATAAVQSEKDMLWVYGANHNFFNWVWTPVSGISCASDDGSGEGRLNDALQRLVACQSVVPFFRLQLQKATGYRALFRGEVVVEGLDGVRMFWTRQDPIRKEVDNFDTGDNPTTNSLGGAVTTSGGFTTFDEYEFKASGPDLFNGSFQHFTHGLVLGWSSTQTYETALPAGNRDVSGYSALSLRIAQILNAANPLDAPRTLRVRLKTGAGTLSGVDFDLAGVQSVPYPYEYNGGKTVLGTLRIPLGEFRTASGPLPLTDIASIVIEFRDTGLVAIDDIQFTK